MFIITILMMVSNIYIYIRVNYKIYFRVFLVEQNGNHTLLYYWRANLTHTLQTEDRHQSFAPPMSITLKRRARWPMIDLVSKSATMSSVLQWYTSNCYVFMYGEEASIYEVAASLKASDVGGYRVNCRDVVLCYFNTPGL